MSSERLGNKGFTRRDFVCLSTLGVGARALLASSQTAQAQEEKPRLELDMIYDFVSAAHKDLDRVEQLFTEEPALLNASWDWGNGDWETAIGGSGHMGRRDITQYLLDQGARIDIFGAAMMGYLDVVKGMLNAHPNLINSLGPHRITLQRHAKAGGVEAEPVLKYLESLKK